MALHEFIAGAVGVGTIAILAAWSSPNPMVPIDELTPGVVASADPAEVCSIVGGMTYSERHRAARHDKAHSMLLYGYDVREHAKYEHDHRVPLCLGGADVPANMWPEPWQGQMNAHDKDDLEKWACRSVCFERHASLQEAKDSLREAQEMFLGDWREAFYRVFR